MLYLKNFNSKKWFFLLAIIILSLSIAACSQKNVEGMVATVDGQGIRQEEFDTDYKVYRTMFEKQLGEDALDQVGSDGKTFDDTLKEDILEKLITEQIVSQEAEAMNIVVTDEEIAQNIELYIKNMGGEDAFNEFLASNDISKEYIETNMGKEILVQKHKQNYLEGVNISQEEAKEYFEENKDAMTIIRASHILVGTEEEGNEILKKLKNGQDFATLAIENSLDSVSALQGGDLEYFGKGAMIPEFEDATFALKEGETSDLVKTEVGYHIIRVAERLDTFEELEEEIIKILEEQSYVNMVQQLRNDAKVEKY